MDFVNCKTYCIFAPMETKQSKLVTISSYAKMYGITRQAAFYRVKQGKLNTVQIDGKTFVKLN